MWASREATCAAMSRTTVSIVPSAGARTEAYPRWEARAIAAPTTTRSTSSPGREISSSAAPRMGWERMTPLLPRAPSSAARATESANEAGGRTRASPPATYSALVTLPAFRQRVQT